MKRRDATRLLFGATVAGPLAARAQQPAIPVIGFLHSNSLDQNRERVAAFRRGLKSAGLIEGRDVVIDFRWADGDYARLPGLAADLAARNAAVIVTLSSTPAAMAAKAATTTVPIYFLIAEPPVPLGLVSSLNRPGGNATGIITLAAEILPKRLELLHEAAPRAGVLAVLVNPAHPSAKSTAAAVRETADALKMPAQVLEAATDDEIDAAFAALKPGAALLVGTDPFLFVRRARLAALAIRHAAPTMFDNSEAAAAGGLLSYGANIESLWERAATNVARLLKGEKPATLPVEQATNFWLAVNLRTARLLGLQIPPRLLATADDVIE